MKVAVLNFEGAIASSVAGAYDILGKIEGISQAMNIPTKMVFDVDVVNTVNSINKEPFYLVGNKTIADDTNYDLVIIPPMIFQGIETTLQRELAMVNWINRQYAAGSAVASMCLGAFILASTGLLNGKKATTHWIGASYFKQAFPDVILEDDKIIIDQGRIYTSGGAYSFTSLMIYLVEKFAGRDIALAASKVFMIQIHDSAQHAFSIFDSQHRHNDADISKVQTYIEKNFKERLTVNDLAEKFNLTPRTFIRRFTNATANSILEYIQRVRVEASKRMFEEGKLTVEEVCHRVGYEDFQSFRNVFKKFTGVSPQDYKRRYGQMFNSVNVG